MTSSRVIAVLLGICMVWHVAVGDTLVTKSGSRYKGTVEEHGDSYVLTMAGGGKITLPRSMVKEVITTPLPGAGKAQPDKGSPSKKPSAPKPKPPATHKPTTPSPDDWRTSYPAFVAEMQKIINAHAPKAAPQKDSAFVSFLAIHSDKQAMIYIVYHGTKLRTVYEKIDKAFGGKWVHWCGTVEDVKEVKNGADVTIRMAGGRLGRVGWRYPETFTVTVSQKEGGLAAANRMKGHQMAIRGHIPSKSFVADRSFLKGVVVYYGVGQFAGKKNVAVYFDKKSLVPIDDKTTRPPDDTGGTKPPATGKEPAGKRPRTRIRR